MSGDNVPAAVELSKPLQRRYEGRRLKPYLCPAGVATIGYGATAYENGRKVRLSDPPITAERAEELLDHDSALYVRLALKYSPTLAASPRRLAAIGDFCFNLGGARYRASTLKRRVDERNWPEAMREIRKWVFGGGRKLPGLVKRREDEAQMLRFIPASKAPAPPPVDPRARILELAQQIPADSRDPIGDLLALLLAEKAKAG